MGMGSARKNHLKNIYRPIVASQLKPTFDNRLKYHVEQIDQSRKLSKMKLRDYINIFGATPMADRNTIMTPGFEKKRKQQSLSP